MDEFEEEIAMIDEATERIFAEIASLKASVASLKARADADGVSMLRYASLLASEDKLCLLDPMTPPVRRSVANPGCYSFSCVTTPGTPAPRQNREVLMTHCCAMFKIWTERGDLRPNDDGTWNFDPPLDGFVGPIRLCPFCGKATSPGTRPSMAGEPMSSEMSPRKST
jgi:hypothetical protein